MTQLEPGEASQAVEQDTTEAAGAPRQEIWTRRRVILAVGVVLASIALGAMAGIMTGWLYLPESVFSMPTVDGQEAASFNDRVGGTAGGIAGGLVGALWCLAMAWATRRWRPAASVLSGTLLGVACGLICTTLTHLAFGVGYGFNLEAFVIGWVIATIAGAPTGLICGALWWCAGQSEPTLSHSTRVTA